VHVCKPVLVQLLDQVPAGHRASEWVE
jgi:hypothetical protein